MTRVRCDVYTQPEIKSSWKQAARDEGKSLSHFVVDAVRAYLSDSSNASLRQVNRETYALLCEAMALIRTGKADAIARFEAAIDRLQLEVLGVTDGHR